MSLFNMRGIEYIPPDINIPFMRWKWWYFVFSIVLIVGSIGIFLVKGLNYGIDFAGGVLIEIRTEGPADLAKLRSTLGDLGLGEVALQEYGMSNDVLIRIERQPGGDEAQTAAVERVKTALGPGVEYRRVETVGPQVSQELFVNGMIALFGAIGGIIVYIWFRFEWQFAIGAVVAELHDVISTIGLFSLLGLEFNLTSIAALLTIAGYSINDTVVVYDRVRENLRKYKKMPLEQLLNMSINQTLSRTFNTGGTVLLALLALYFLGGDVIRGFALAMIWGLFVGTYSSICAAVPLLVIFKLREGKVATGEAVEPTP
ncbi:MAG: protein translocase subunit SecF [Rhodospirillales bacterium]